MNRTYALSDGTGRRMSIKITGCDSGGREGVTTNGYQFYRQLRRDGDASRFQLLRGNSIPSHPRAQISFPDSHQRDKKAAARGDVPVLMFNSNILKDTLRGRLDCMVPGKGMVRYGKWLPDAWYSEMCVEVRDDKGWHNPKHLRNEAWDLSYYALGLCISSLVRVEGIDWENPPGWATTWEKNDLISSFKAPTVAAFDPSRRHEKDIDFSSFGNMLG
jgi:phage terminase large subunit GpA-like protein